jgi:hypothetical protein
VSPLEATNRPVRTISDPDSSFASLLSFLEARGVVDSEPPSHADFLLDLVEFEGGGWALFEPSERLVADLSPEHFQEVDLNEWYEADGVSQIPHPGQRMLQALDALRTVLAETDANAVVLVHLH